VRWEAEKRDLTNEKKCEEVGKTETREEKRRNPKTRDLESLETWKHLRVKSQKISQTKNLDGC
jgi:CelD/BcsL family acetyltransferase involved in cellulose biosynthesis